MTYVPTDFYLHSAAKVDDDRTLMTKLRLASEPKFRRVSVPRRVVWERRHEEN
jgi:hypothetical protein